MILRAAQAFLSKERLVLVAVASSIVGGSFFIGREIGRYNSPDYSKESSALVFLTTHMHVVSVDDKDVKLSVATNFHAYEYSLSDNNVTRQARPAFELAGLKIKKRWALLEDKRIMEFAGIVSTIPAAAAAMSKIPREAGKPSIGGSPIVYAFGAAALATGGIVGYFTTFDDTADYDNEVFRRTLQDATNWQSTALHLQLCRSAGIATEFAEGKHALPSSVTETNSRCAKLNDWLKDHL